MKVQKITKPSTFQPVELKITIESEEELDKFAGVVQFYEEIATCLNHYNVINSEDASFFEDVLQELYKAL